MKLWLVRHTHAVTEAENPLRPLSRKGRLAARKLGGFLGHCGALEGASHCWHSGLARAAETAGLLLKSAQLNLPQEQIGSLQPEDDPCAIAERLEKWLGGDLVLVGHNPHLSALGTLLIRGRVNPLQFDLRKGAVVALESTDGIHRKTGLRRWQVRWLLSPELLRGVPEPIARRQGSTPM